MVSELPTLAILPVANLILHEHHDHQRAIPLIQALRASGILRNPPIVTPLRDRSNRYMVMDGANRATAFKEMGVPHLLCQVVQPDDPNLKLQTWHHILAGLSSEGLLQGLVEANLSFREIDLPEGYSGLNEQQFLSVVYLRSGDSYALAKPPGKLNALVETLNVLVDSYRTRASFDRTTTHEAEQLVKMYPDFTSLVMFPRFRIDEITFLAGEGHLLPSGITRFSVSPRALRVNYPLEALTSPTSLQEKNESLQRWIQDRVALKGVRYYAEATFLFDE